MVGKIKLVLRRARAHCRHAHAPAAAARSGWSPFVFLTQRARPPSRHYAMAWKVSGNGWQRPQLKPVLSTGHSATHAVTGRRKVLAHSGGMVGGEGGGDAFQRGEVLPQSNGLAHTGSLPRECWIACPCPC